MARNRMKLKFQEGDRRELRVFFEEVLKPMSGDCVEVYRNILEFARQVNFKEINWLVGDFKKQYETTLKAGVFKNFEKWQESEANVQAFVKNSGAGDSDDEIMVEARKFEEQLKEITERMTSKELENPTSGTIVYLSMSEDEAVEQIADYYSKEIAKVEEIISDTKRRVRDKREDNYFYAPVGDLLDTILRGYLNFFKELRTGTKKNFAEQLGEKAARAIKNEEGEKKNLKSHAEEIADSLRHDSDIFKKFF